MSDLTKIMAIPAVGIALIVKTAKIALNALVAIDVTHADFALMITSA